MIIYVDYIDGNNFKTLSTKNPNESSLSLMTVDVCLAYTNLKKKLYPPSFLRMFYFR